MGRDDRRYAASVIAVCAMLLVLSSCAPRVDRQMGERSWLIETPTRAVVPPLPAWWTPVPAETTEAMARRPEECMQLCDFLDEADALVESWNALMSDSRAGRLTEDIEQARYEDYQDSLKQYRNSLRTVGVSSEQQSVLDGFGEWATQMSRAADRHVSYLITQDEAFRLEGNDLLGEADTIKARTQRELVRFCYGE